MVIQLKVKMVLPLGFFILFFTQPTFASFYPFCGSKPCSQPPVEAPKPNDFDRKDAELDFQEGVVPPPSDLRGKWMMIGIVMAYDEFGSPRKKLVWDGGKTDKGAPMNLLEFAGGQSVTSPFDGRVTSSDASVAASNFLYEGNNQGPYLTRFDGGSACFSLRIIQRTPKGEIEKVLSSYDQFSCRLLSNNKQLMICAITKYINPDERGWFVDWQGLDKNEYRGKVVTYEAFKKMAQ